MLKTAVLQTHAVESPALIFDDGASHNTDAPTHIVQAAMLSAIALLVSLSTYEVLTASALEVVHVDILKGASDRGIGIYSPDSITIKVGDTVTWVNSDINPHTVTSGKPYDRDAAQLFSSKRLVSNQQFSHTFTSVGTFDYFCLVHHAMTGTIIVEEGPPAILLSSERFEYSVGHPVVMKGTVSAIRNSPMQIEVVNPAGISYLIDSIQVASNGSFEYSFIAPGMQGHGTFNVIVKYLGASAETSFRIEPRSHQPSSSPSSATSQTAGPIVTAVSTEGSLRVLIGIKNTLPVDFYTVSFVAPESGINYLKAPREWHGEIDGRDAAAIFTTHDNPVEQDRRFAFLVATHFVVQSLDWVVFDSEGNPIAKGFTDIRFRR